MADLPSILDSFACSPECPVCLGGGTVCERCYLPWGDGSEHDAGMPCPLRTPCDVPAGGKQMRGGYVRVRIAGRYVLAHRHAWEEANGPIPDGLCVLHHCDNPPCRNVDHLFLGTRSDNNRDRHRKGRDARQSGEANGRARLTDSQVAEIRSRYRPGARNGNPPGNVPELAAEYGVSVVHLRNLVHYRRRN